MAVRRSVEKRFAEFYQLWVHDFEQDVPIYRDLVAKADGPVLEVGAATGRVTEHLARAGHEVVAVDIRREMLELAQARLREIEPPVRVVDYDLRHQPLAERFPAILVSLFFFNTLIDIEEQRLFLRHVCRSLGDPGVLAIDCFCPISLVRPDDVGVWREVRRQTPKGELLVRDHREMLTPLLERRTQIFKLGQDDEFEFTTHRRYVTPQQVASLLEEAGFESVHWASSYDMSTEADITPDSRPDGPFMVLARRDSDAAE